LQKQKTKDKFAWQTCTCINKQKRRTKQDHVGHHVVSQAITRPGSCQTFSSKQWSSPSIQEMPGPGFRGCTFSDRKSSSGCTLVSLLPAPHTPYPPKHTPIHMHSYWPFYMAYELTREALINRYSFAF